jgi:hypothetical protein
MSVKLSQAEIERELAAHEARRNRPLDVQCTEAREYMRQAIAENPQYQFILPVVDQPDDVCLLILETTIRGALEGRLDFHEMLFYWHPDPARRRAARRKTKAMSQGKLPFMREQMQ